MTLINIFLTLFSAIFLFDISQNFVPPLYFFIDMNFLIAAYFRRLVEILALIWYGRWWAITYVLKNRVFSKLRLLLLECFFWNMLWGRPFRLFRDPLWVCWSWKWSLSFYRAYSFRNWTTWRGFYLGKERTTRNTSCLPLIT